MGYPMDLDEYDEERLLKELRRREKARTVGLCDYCGRTRDTTTCRFIKRHRAEGLPVWSGTAPLHLIVPILTEQRDEARAEVNAMVAALMEVPVLTGNPAYVSPAQWAGVVASEIGRLRAEAADARSSCAAWEQIAEGAIAEVDRLRAELAGLRGGE